MLAIYTYTLWGAQKTLTHKRTVTQLNIRQTNKHTTHLDRNYFGSPLHKNATWLDSIYSSMLNNKAFSKHLFMQHICTVVMKMTDREVTYTRESACARHHVVIYNCTKK